MNWRLRAKKLKLRIRRMNGIFVVLTKSSSVFIKYLVQVFISLIVLIFSIVQLSMDDKRDKSIYISLISTILGLFVPAPTLDKK